MKNKKHSIIKIIFYGRRTQRLLPFYECAPLAAVENDIRHSFTKVRVLRSILDDIIKGKRQDSTYHLTRRIPMAILGGIMVPHPPLIIPEVGRGEEKEIQETIDAYKKAAEFLAGLKPETVIVSTPHSIMYADYFHISPGAEADGNFGQFRAGKVKIHADYDTDLVREISRICASEDFPAGTAGERSAALDHATMIPLYFLNQFYSHYSVVRIGLSGLPLTDHYRLGQFCAEASERLGRRVAWIASGDLSHKLQTYGPYGFDADGPVYDERIMDVMGSASFDRLLDFSEDFCEKAAECGHRSFVMMSGFLDGMDVRAQKLSHQDVTGVGYGVCTYEVTGEDPSRHMLEKWQHGQQTKLQEKQDREDPYVRLARRQVEAWVRKRKRLSDKEIVEILSGADTSELLHGRAGAFVSIHENGQLRGCIGTISATQDCVAKEITQNAVSACSRDPRFSAVRSSELPFLEISVDVLGEAEPVQSKDQLDVKKYGVIVTKGFRRGLLLPNLDGVDTVEEQISIALQKAGLSPHEKNIELERFEVVRHE